MDRIKTYLADLSLESVIFGNSLQKYLFALCVFVVSFVIAVIALRILKAAVNRIVKSFGDTTFSKLIDGEERLVPIVKYIPIYVTARYLTLPQLVMTVIEKLWIIILVICIIRYLLWVIQVLSRDYIARNKENLLISHNINLFASIILYLLGTLFVLSNLGFNVNTLIAGVGIGGMAIALASQTLLGDLFNYFTIMVDKPFTIGDNVTVGGVNGTVEQIGLKGTRIRSSNGELIVISNTDMTKNILQNFQKMKKRRMLMTLGVTYDTSDEDMKAIPALLTSIVKSVKKAEFARVHFSAFADSSMNFELVFFVLSNNYTVYMDTVQEINYKILLEFRKRNIEFAFPSQSIYSMDVTPRGLTETEE